MKSEDEGRTIRGGVTSKDESEDVKMRLAKIAVTVTPGDRWPDGDFTV